MSSPVINLERLKEPFSENEIEFRLSQCGEGSGGIWAQCLAYITSRAIMDRLDAVCGPSNWKVSYEFVGASGVVCNLSILLNGQWVTKQDGAEMTNIESFKGGISSALKRAGSAWGMGRYLYSLEAAFIPASNIFQHHKDGAHFGKTKSGKNFYWLPPKLPAWALPKVAESTPPPSNVKPIQPIAPMQQPKRKPSDAQMKRLSAIVRGKNISEQDLDFLLRSICGLNSIHEMTLEQYQPFCNSILDGTYINHLHQDLDSDIPEMPWEKYLQK